METNGGPDNTPVDSEIAGTVWFRLVLPDFDERRTIARRCRQRSVAVTPRHMGHGNERQQSYWRSLRSRPCAVTAQITNTSNAMMSNAHHG